MVVTVNECLINDDCCSNMVLLLPWYQVVIPNSNIHTSSPSSNRTAQKFRNDGKTRDQGERDQQVLVLTLSTNS